MDEAAPEKGSPKKLKAVETKENEKGNVKTEEDLRKTDENLAEEKQTKANSKPLKLLKITFMSEQEEAKLLIAIVLLKE